MPSDEEKWDYWAEKISEEIGWDEDMSDGEVADVEAPGETVVVSPLTQSLLAIQESLLMIFQELREMNRRMRKLEEN